ncbi:DUF4355 domain-containing protein [Niallia sp. 01092]|uniref:DUF4355 domain-containing protein n=1 Tax=Niallia sp. 01092 TaxID=3457759 RepID=UPI003FCF60F9
MDLKEVREFLMGQKDTDNVKALLGELYTPTVDGVKGFLEDNEDGKKLLQSLSDSRVTQGIETFKKNNLEKLIEDEMAKRNMSETPEQKQIRELKELIAARDKEALTKELKAEALTTLSEKKLPVFLVDQLLGNDSESTKQNLTKFEEQWNAQIQTVKDEILKNNGTVIDDGSNGGGSTGNFMDAILSNQTRK